MSHARRFRRRLPALSLGGKTYEAGELTASTVIEALGQATSDAADWFECRYCGKLAGRVSDEAKASVFGNVFHVTPSCQRYREMTGREFVEANVRSPRVEMGSLRGGWIGALPELPKGD